MTIRPLRRVSPGLAHSRDEHFELLKGQRCWQVRSLTADGAAILRRGGASPICRLRRELAEWLEEIVERD